MGSPLPPHSLIFEKFEKSTAVPDMAPEPYPASLNQEGIDWPKGVRPCSIMEKQHDLDMLDQLR